MSEFPTDPTPRSKRKYTKKAPPPEPADVPTEPPSKPKKKRVLKHNLIT
jgi:hypothetical protein